MIATSFRKSRDQFHSEVSNPFITIKHNISDNRKAVALLGRLLTAGFVSDRRFGPRLQRIYATAFLISTSEFQFL